MLYFLLNIKILNYFFIFHQNIDTDPWLAHYLRGSSMEMYTEYLSPSFIGKTFTDAAMYLPYFAYFSLLNHNF